MKFSSSLHLICIWRSRDGRASTCEVPSTYHPTAVCASDVGWKEKCSFAVKCQNELQFGKIAFSFFLLFLSLFARTPSRRRLRKRYLPHPSLALPPPPFLTFRPFNLPRCFFIWQFPEALLSIPFSKSGTINRR